MHRLEFLISSSNFQNIVSNSIRRYRDIKISLAVSELSLSGKNIPISSKFYFACYAPGHFVMQHNKLYSDSSL